MHKIFLILFFGIGMYQSEVQAQRTINFSGKIDNFKASEQTYLGIDGNLLDLKILDGGTFSVDAVIQQNPTFFYFAKISKRGKIERLSPRIWFENDSVQVNLDWSNKSFQLEKLMPYQSFSELLEASKGKKQVRLLLNKPNEVPSLYFADKNKEEIAISDLEKFYQSLNKENKEHIYTKRLESYLSAKRRAPLKKGKRVENFKLPNESGKYSDVVNKNGKPQVIALFSSGCAYSIASISLLEQLSELNKDKMEIVTIWDDQSKSTWLNSYKDEKSKITWTNLWDEYGFAKTYLNRTMWPTFYVINENGELTQVLKGYDKKTAKALKELIE